MRTAARRLEKLTAKLPPPAVTKLAIAVIDRLVTGEQTDERALADLESRVAALDARERAAHRDTCLLARHLSEHSAEAGFRVAAWTAQIAGRVAELFALDDARRYLSLVRFDTAIRIEDAREEHDAERAAVAEGLAARHREDAERLDTRWKAAFADLREIGARDPIGVHRAMLAELEKQVGPDAIPARIRKPIELVEGARAALPETIAILEECERRHGLFAQCADVCS